MFPDSQRFGCCGKRHRQRRERQTRHGQETAFTRQASRYSRLLAERYQRSSEGRLLLQTPAQVGSALVTYSNHPRAGTHRLPRTARALKGENSHPGKTNKAYPLLLWEALSVDLTERHLPSMALFLLLAVATYCRPKELLALRRQDIVPPCWHTMKHWSLLFHPSGTNARSKTGLQCTCDILDTQ